MDGAQPQKDGATAAKLTATVDLRVPFEFGKEADGKARLVEQLVLRPSSRAFREYSLPIREDGTTLYQPYDLAKVGMQMAGFPAAIVDKLDMLDMMEVAQKVMGFIGHGLKTGSSQSP